MSTSGATGNRLTASLWIGFLIAAVVAPAISNDGERNRYPGYSGNLHRGPGVSNHPVNVVPSSDIQIPEGWPLAADGSITCLTCHAALPTMGERTDPGLRNFDGLLEDSAAFCTRCHAEQRQSAAAMHWAAVGVAHVMPDRGRRARSVGGLDGESRRCLACHDGVNAIESQNMTGWNRGPGYRGNRTGNHPVGIRYPRAGQRGSGAAMRPAGLLPREVRLPGGTVSCISCHDLYARDRHLLTVSLDGSKLCFTCHDLD